jgi:transcriptional regulator with XRE-family HTH domain
MNLMPTPQKMLDEDNALEASLGKIARRVKRWREQADMTLKELADLAGVSASTVHKVENCQVSPTVSVLLRIANGLNRPAVDLISMDEDLPKDYLVTRAEDRVRIRDSDGTFIEKADRDLANPLIDLWRATIQPGANSQHYVQSEEGELIVRCDEGEIAFWVNGEEVHLGAGDSIHFKAWVSRRWENRSDKVAKISVAVSIPRKIERRNADPLNYVWRHTMDQQTRERRFTRSASDRPGLYPVQVKEES